jgi:hypothetical protein
MLTAYLRSNPADYAIVNTTRFTESINIRFRILLYSVWLGALIFFLRMTWTQAANRGKLQRLTFAGKLALPLACTAMCLLVLWGINDILLWLPNLSALNHSLFTEIFAINLLPPDVYLSAGLSRIWGLSRQANFAFIAGLTAYANIVFLLHLNRRV